MKQEANLNKSQLIHYVVYRFFFFFFIFLRVKKSVISGVHHYPENQKLATVSALCPRSSKGSLFIKPGRTQEMKISIKGTG